MNSPTIVLDRISYPSVGLVSILGLVFGLGLIYQSLQVDVISFGLAVGLYFGVAILFGVIYGDLWVLDSQRDE